MKFLRYLLLPFSVLYSLILRIRNLLFDTGILPSYKAPLPVICIGNLSLGGTGKTPHTEYLIRLFSKEFKTATLSRGYGRRTKGFRYVEATSLATETGDEPLQLKKKFREDIVVAVCENRKEGLLKLSNDHPETALILLDDAFQHRRVQAGLNILLTDYTHPFFRDFVLPAGNLREPRSGLKRADVVIITKCPETITENQYDYYRKRIPGKEIFFSFIRYGIPLSLQNDSPLISPLENSNVLLLTGIANSRPLEKYLLGKNCRLQKLEFPDHHEYSGADMDKLMALFESMSEKNNIIVTTEKDAMRLRQPQTLKLIEKLPLYYVPIHIEFNDNDSSRFQNILHRYVNGNKKCR
jgi:tetraacyldisaccharide 4'-kinase